jgi:hypothetical protein
VLVHSPAERLLYYNLKKLSGYEDHSIPNIKVSTVTRRDNVTYSIVKYKISSGALHCMTPTFENPKSLFHNKT